MPDENAEPAADGAIVNTRVLPASRAAVFALYRDPAALARWWGPRGCTNAFEVFEFRPGGAWRFTMRLPDGASFPMDHRFEGIVPDERIVIRHRQAGHDFTIAVDLADAPGGTRMTWRMRFDDAAEGRRLHDFIFAANEQNFDRLAALLGPSTAPL